MKFPYNKKTIVVDACIERVFEAVIESAQGIPGFHRIDPDKSSWSIRIRVSISWFSWGERMLICLRSLSKNKTEIAVSSETIYGIGYTGELKNQKNIDRLLNAIAEHPALSVTERNYEEDMS